MTRGRALRRFSVALSAVLAALIAGPARASTSTVIDVFPGPNAIQGALGQANAGDTLNIHAGTYAENVSVDVGRVRLQAAGDGQVTVDGRCLGTTINVGTNGVTIEGLTIIGGDFFNLNFQFVSHGVVSNSSLSRTCPDTEYGINLYQTGAMQILGNTAVGFYDAGIYIGAITDTGNGTLLASHNDLYGNRRGIIVEDSVGVSLLVVKNSAHDNYNDGIFLHNSDGIDVRMNRTTANGYAGIEIDDLSDNNLIRLNRSLGQTYDLANDGGSGNCFKNNQYVTSLGTIAC
jgi:parallel beta-helix repeat protein